MLFYHEMEEKVWKAFLPTYLDERQQNKTFSFQHFNQLEHRRCWKFASEIQSFKRYVALQCWQHHNNERGSKSKTIVTTTWWFQIQVLLIWTGHFKPLDKSSTYWIKFHHKHWKLEKYLYTLALYTIIHIHYNSLQKAKQKNPRNRKGSEKQSKGNPNH